MFGLNDLNINKLTKCLDSHSRWSNAIMLFGRVYKTITVRMTIPKLFWNNSPSVKLVTKKSKIKREQEKVLGFGSSRDKVRGESENIIPVRERVCPFLLRSLANVRMCQLPCQRVGCWLNYAPRVWLISSPLHHRCLSPSMRVADETYRVSNSFTLKLGLRNSTSISSPPEISR